MSDCDRFNTHTLSRTSPRVSSLHAPYIYSMVWMCERAAMTEGEWISSYFDNKSEMLIFCWFQLLKSQQVTPLFPPAQHWCWASSAVVYFWRTGSHFDRFDGVISVGKSHWTNRWAAFANHCWISCSSSSENSSSNDPVPTPQCWWKTNHFCLLWLFILFYLFS